MCHEIRSASITHQSLINNAINNNINKNNGRHLQSSPQHCRNRSTKREQSKSKNIASWMMINQEQPHKHCIINNPNCRLSVKHYSSKRVVQGTINNSITTMISCATQQEQVMWRLTYIVNTMQQELQHPLMSDHHFSALQQIYQHRHSSNNNAMIAQQQQQKIPEMDNNTNVRYMIPICLTTNIMSLSNGFTVNNKKSKSASSYGGRFVHHGTTWIKDKWRRWCL
ncbi:hypothetical protein BDA99DRAFT_529556 [Phascolomyces articulosus]|uniref:Uncharacterized protein n=1 Tax=Phascolomyces articulosus TaxID=60185 RepID=A0AAD5P6Z4_9FUNG|nr:hypothetical protein BDA99DRAFT_529556 [Phascolomyces articulosus]